MVEMKVFPKKMFHKVWRHVVENRNGKRLNFSNLCGVGFKAKNTFGIL